MTTEKNARASFTRRDVLWTGAATGIALATSANWLNHEAGAAPHRHRV